MVALLLAPLALAQGPLGYRDADVEEAGVFAPVQAVVDRVPVVVDDAVREALRDGTPDAAQLEAERMQAFVEGWGHPQWPQGSVAAGQDAAAYAYAHDVVAVTVLVPAEIGRLSRVDADCTARTEEATAAEARRWALDHREATERLEGFLAVFRLVAESAPDTLDPAPLLQAADRLDAWDLPARVAACVVVSVERTEAEPVPDRDHLVLVPETAYPTATVRVIGRGTGALEAPGLGWSQRPEGVFRYALQVHRDAPEGDHVVRLGDHEAVLTVAAAPVELVVQAPGRVAAGEPFTVRVEARTPAPHLLEEIVLAGDLEGRADGAVARFAMQAPETPQVLEAEARAGGWPVQEARAPFTVEVVPQALVDRDADGAGAGGARGPLWAPGGPFTFPDVPVTPLTLVLVVLAALALFGLVELVLGLRRPAAKEVQAAPAPPASPRLPAALVAAFAVMVAWLVERGAVRRSHTPREVARRLREEGLDADGVVAEFERRRYGGQRRPGVGARAVARLRMFMARWRST